MPRVFTTPEQAAAAIAAAAVAALRTAKYPSLALSGGRAGELALGALASLEFDWSTVDFFWCDERRVPLEHPRSNYGLAARLLLDPRGVPRERRHPLVNALAAPAGLSVALLGVGEDGHTASLFAGSPALKSKGPVAESRAPDGEARLTLTPAFLNKAGRRLVLVTGAAKAAVVAKALEKPTSDLPIQRLAVAPDDWFLDKAAASEL